MTVEGSPWMPEAISRSRVAELIVVFPGGRNRRGSGYRVGAQAVLTAAHVVEGAVSVGVRFEPDLPGQWIVDTTSWWVDPHSDLAVISIPAQPGEPPIAHVRFGRITDGSAVLAAQAVGFPRWKLRNYGGTVRTDDTRPYRDAHHAAGSVAVLSNFREGTLEVNVSPPADDPNSTVSQWEGMSGAALWVGDRIVGVIAEHHRDDGLGRLAAARLDLALELLDAGQRDELRALLPQLPDDPRRLPDVVPVSARALITTAYQAQLAGLAPEQLLDRDTELAGLVAFCAGDQPYAWWQAGPWAGKSALLYWFVLHPPAGIDVVSFFITRRYSGQSDSDAFTDALLEQLAGLTGETPVAVPIWARPGQLLRLLEGAAHRSREAGRRLLVVVDGLDEDTSTATGRPSIAGLLPFRPPHEVRVLVASRPNPDLPGDVDDDHPLCTITPQPLTASPHALHVKRLAKNELDKLVTGTEFQQEVLGLITASGGGLTRTDLEELTRRPPYELDGLGGLFGRTVGGRISPTPAVGRPAERVYLFTHETLREVAEEQYGASLAKYRDRLHAWAAAYRDRSWPPETPLYLLRGYPRLLAATGDLDRLLAAATDRTRQDRMLDLTGGDALALTEISTTTNLITQQPTPDLGALLLLAVTRDDLTERNSNIPAVLPSVWIILAHPTRATALAHGISDPEVRVRALTWMVTEAFNAGDRDHAKRLATTAEQQVSKITDPKARAQALTDLSGAVAAAGFHDRAEQLAREITDPGSRSEALTGLARVVAVAGDHDRAERLAQEITDPRSRAAALTKLARAVAAAGDDDGAARLATVAEQHISEITTSVYRAEELSELARVVAAAGDHDRAARLATAAERTSENTGPSWRAKVLIKLVGVAAATGDHDCAERLISAAEQLVREITQPELRAVVVAQLIGAVAAAGDHDGAERLATAAERTSENTGPSWHAKVLIDLVEVVAVAGDHDRAVRLATAAEQHSRKITNPEWRVRDLIKLARVVALAGDHDRAARLAQEIIDPQPRTEALIDLVEVVAVAGDHDRADPAGPGGRGHGR
jgi:lipopolysaccharide biosynthesis regulator YciM